MQKWSMVMAVAGLATVAAFPAFADMMKKGEVLMVMPDGRTMDTERMKTEEMIKAAKPMDGCVIMMMGQDGKMYMANDMKMADGRMVCETAMTMKKKK
jgi:hypothetical protein